jgi:hypothetical protein
MTFPRRSQTHILPGFCNALVVQRKSLGLPCLCIQSTFEASGTALWCLFDPNETDVLEGFLTIATISPLQ